MNIYRPGNKVGQSPGKEKRKRICQEDKKHRRPRDERPYLPMLKKSQVITGYLGIGVQVLREEKSNRDRD